jgi:hypothetical protein
MARPATRQFWVITIEIRAPFRENSEVAIRLDHNERRGRKINLTATLDSKDGFFCIKEERISSLLVELDQ